METGWEAPPLKRGIPPHIPPHKYQSLAIALNGLNPSQCSGRDLTSPIQDGWRTCIGKGELTLIQQDGKGRTRAHLTVL